MRWLGLLVLLVCPLGCSRTWYRLDADQESYAALNEKLNDPRWQLSRLNIDSPPDSRLYDPSNPDRPPMPPDDPAAHGFMHNADGHRGWKHWHRNGDSPSVEDREWRNYLKLEPDGTLKLTPEEAVRLALLHSREYQTQQEDLFLAALALTLNRFEFALQWFATNNTNFEHFGTGGFPTETNTLSTSSAVGFTKAFATGAQLLVNLANSFTWEFTGKTNTVNGNFGMTLIQPLLRNAGRQVRLESLTQGERNLLYAVRRFARFRKEFYFSIAVDQYQALLQATQQIRNLEANLKTREQQYLIIGARRTAGEASIAEEEQAYSSFQQSQIQLIQAKTNFENQMDQYKLLLGLPPDVPIKLDDTILKPFEFAAPELVAFQDQAIQFVKSVAKPDDPGTVAQLSSDYQTLAAMRKRAESFAIQVRAEVVKLKDKEMRRPLQDTESSRRLRYNIEQLDKQSLELIDDIKKFIEDVQRKAANITEDGRKVSQSDIWRKARDLGNLIGQTYVIQTQARIYLLELPTFQAQETESIDYALAERLDLMNQRAAVVDAWRQVEIAANQLQGVVNLQADMNLATQADASGPFDFSAMASRYRVGLQLDGPLNRQAERNAYRQTLINYQRARRQFMAFEDNIVRSIRQDVRQLMTDGLNFNINRQSLIATARQIEQNQYSLLFNDRNGQADTTAILTALDNLLNAQNGLIAQWFSYERGRLRLLLDTEQFQVDDDGIYRNANQSSLSPASGFPAPNAGSQPPGSVQSQPGPGQPPTRPKGP